MRRTCGGPAATLLVLLTGTACASTSVTGGSSASCVAPQLGARPFRGLAPHDPVVVRPGTVLVVHGRFFTHDCFDSGPEAGSRERPDPQVHLVLVTSDHQTTPLAVAHPAGRLSTFVVRVRIPDRAATGPARIDDGGGTAAGLPLVVRSP